MHVFKFFEFDMYTTRFIHVSGFKFRNISIDILYNNNYIDGEPICSDIELSEPENPNSNKSASIS